MVSSAPSVGCRRARARTLSLDRSSAVNDELAKFIAETLHIDCTADGS